MSSFKYSKQTGTVSTASTAPVNPSGQPQQFNQAPQIGPSLQPSALAHLNRLASQEQPPQSSVQKLINQHQQAQNQNLANNQSQNPASSNLNANQVSGGNTNHSNNMTSTLARETRSTGGLLTHINQSNNYVKNNGSNAAASQTLTGQRKSYSHITSLGSLNKNNSNNQQNQHIHGNQQQNNESKPMVSSSNRSADVHAKTGKTTVGTGGPGTGSRSHQASASLHDVKDSKTLKTTTNLSGQSPAMLTTTKHGHHHHQSAIHSSGSHSNIHNSKSSSDHPTSKHHHYGPQGYQNNGFKGTHHATLGNNSSTSQAPTTNNNQTNNIHGGSVLRTSSSQHLSGSTVGAQQSTNIQGASTSTNIHQMLDKTTPVRNLTPKSQNNQVSLPNTTQSSGHNSNQNLNKSHQQADSSNTALRRSSGYQSDSTKTSQNNFHQTQKASNVPMAKEKRTMPKDLPSSQSQTQVGHHSHQRPPTHQQNLSSNTLRHVNTNVNLAGQDSNLAPQPPLNGNQKEEKSRNANSVQYQSNGSNQMQKNFQNSQKAPIDSSRQHTTNSTAAQPHQMQNTRKPDQILNQARELNQQLNQPSTVSNLSQQQRRATSEVGREFTPKPVVAGGQQNKQSQSNLTTTQAQNPESHRITERPSSASAGQRFIGKAQNLKDLFAKNWQNVTTNQKVVDQQGTTAQIKSLTVLDTNLMVHEDSTTQQHPELQPGSRIVIPNHEPTKCSFKRNGIVRAYAANTNQGLVRTYNEDRVSIILNIVKPEHRQKEEWPKCSFFGVYDGHGGSACAEFLRDNLHHYVIKEDQFPWQPEEAIKKGFAKAEARFIELCQSADTATGQMTVVERSGSCAIVVLIVGEVCYTANVGDSRAVLSSEGGKHITALSRDHKPADVDEYKRIIKAGGQIYQTTTAQTLSNSGVVVKQNGEQDEFIVGPIRVLPGRLSVCRTFGDPDAKLEYRGGNPNVVKAEPEIKTFQIGSDHDFIALASDGIFDKLTDNEVAKCSWLSSETAKKQAETQNKKSQPGSSNAQQTQNQGSLSVHQYSGIAVEGILKNSLYRQSLDNVTVVMVAFANFKRILCGPLSNEKGGEHKPEKEKKPRENSPLKNANNKDSGKSSGPSLGQHQTHQPQVDSRVKNPSIKSNLNAASHQQAHSQNSARLPEPTHHPTSHSGSGIDPKSSTNNVAPSSRSKSSSAINHHAVPNASNNHNNVPQTTSSLHQKHQSQAIIQSIGNQNGQQKEKENIFNLNNKKTAKHSQHHPSTTQTRGHDRQPSDPASNGQPTSISQQNSQQNLFNTMKHQKPPMRTQKVPTQPQTGAGSQQNNTGANGSANEVNLVGQKKSSFSSAQRSMSLKDITQQTKKTLASSMVRKPSTQVQNTNNESPNQLRKGNQPPSSLQLATGTHKPLSATRYSASNLKIATTSNGSLSLATANTNNNASSNGTTISNLTKKSLTRQNAGLNIGQGQLNNNLQAASKTTAFTSAK